MHVHVGEDGVALNTVYTHAHVQYLQIKKASFEGISVHSGLIVMICELNEVVHLIGEHTVMVSVALRGVVAQSILTLDHLLHTLYTRTCTHPSEASIHVQTHCI